MRRLLKTILLVVLAFVLSAQVALAAWVYLFPTTIFDTSNTTRTYYPVMLGYNGQALVDSSKISASGLDTNMQIGSANISYMIATGNVTAVIPSLPSGGSVIASLYTGFTPNQTTFPVITGSGGNVTVSDNASLEIGDNFSVEVAGWLNTDAGTGKNLATKPGGFRVYISDVTNGTIYGALSDTDNWTAETSASAQQWRGVTWSPELGLFCGVADNGVVGVQVMTSPDGVTWTSRTSANAQQWRSVAWSPKLGMFAAVALDGVVANQIMTSTDGTTWTAATSPSARQWWVVYWAEEVELFIGLAIDGAANQQIMTSTDGVTWTSRTAPNAVQWNSVTYSPELDLLVAVASTGAVATQVMTSADGVTWGAETSANGVQWRSVTWSPELGLFCAVASNGAANQQIMTSPDGAVWTARTAPTALQWWNVVWAEEFGLFIATNPNGLVNQQIMTSPDGINWAHETSPNAQNWYSLAWSPELNMAVALADNGAVGVQVMRNSVVTVSDTGVTSGEYTVDVSANTTHLILSINGTIEDTIALGGMALLDYTNNWAFIQNDVMSYTDNISIDVDGVNELLLSPAVMIEGTNLIDESGNSHNGTINWGSNTGITLAYGEMTSYEDWYAAANITGGFEMTTASMPATWFAGGENVTALPFYDSFLAVSVQTGKPVQAYYFLAIIGVAFGAFLLIVLFSRSALLAYIAMVVVFAIGSSMTIVPGWIVFVLIVVGVGIMYLYKQVAY